jgi:hypothetical protein
MKLFLCSVFAMILFQTKNSIKDDCSEAHDAAENAYSYCKKAFDSDRWDDTKAYLKKAINSFDEAMSYAEDCKCEDAQSSAEEGHSYAKKGYNSTDWDDTKSYAKKARNAADDTMSNADDCDD